MNHLAHFRLAMGEPPFVVGAFLGDHIKGRLRGQFDAQLERGIKLHREIDAFTDAHPLVKRSYELFEPRFRRYCPIMIDIFYDHILARNWHLYHHQTLGDFSQETFAIVEEWQDRMPEPAAAIALRMRESAILERYAEPNTIAAVLVRVSSRLKRANPLADSFQPFLDNMDDLEADFHEFFPLLEEFSAKRIDEWIDEWRVPAPGAVNSGRKKHETA